MNNTIPTRIEGAVNYPFAKGVLESTIRMMIYGNIPGITVDDDKAFSDWIETKLVEVHNRSVKFERGEF